MLMKALYGYEPFTQPCWKSAVQSQIHKWPARVVGTTALPDLLRLAKFAAAIYLGLLSSEQVQENDTKAEHLCRFREPFLVELWALIPNCTPQLQKRSLAVPQV